MYSILFVLCQVLFLYEMYMTRYMLMIDPFGPAPLPAKLNGTVWFWGGLPGVVALLTVSFATVVDATVTSVTMHCIAVTFISHHIS